MEPMVVELCLDTSEFDTAVSELKSFAASSDDIADRIASFIEITPESAWGDFDGLIARGAREQWALLKPSEALLELLATCRACHSKQVAVSHS